MKSRNCRPPLLLLFISILFGSFFSKHCKASEDRKIPYYTYVLLGAAKTGKSSFANLILNYIKEQNEGIGIQSSVVPAWQYDHSAGKRLPSELKGSFFRVALGKDSSPNSGFSVTHTDRFNGYYIPMVGSPFLIHRDSSSNM